MEDIKSWAEATIPYSAYCKEAAKERFKNDIIDFIHRVSFYDKDHFAAKMKAYSIAAEIMKELKEGSPWEVVDTIFQTNAKTILEVIAICDIMLEYSEFGTSFVERSINLDFYREIESLVKKYDAKKEMEFLNGHYYHQ